MTSITEAARALGKRGGLKGGPARARSLTSEERKKIASLGGLAAAKSNRKRKRAKRKATTAA